MITAVDTSVLLDVLLADPTFGPRSRAALQRALAEGKVVACEVVWAETASAVEESRRLTNALSSLGIGYEALSEPAALAAGETFRAYRVRGGPRSRVIADFLVGAHAQISADRLLTRDRGFYRSCFVELQVLDPSTD